jgi:hypothetical protein
MTHPTTDGPTIPIQIEHQLTSGDLASLVAGSFLATDADDWRDGPLPAWSAGETIRRIREQLRQSGEPSHEWDDLRPAEGSADLTDEPYWAHIDAWAAATVDRVFGDQLRAAA